MGKSTREKKTNFFANIVEIYSKLKTLRHRAALNILFEFIKAKRISGELIIVNALSSLMTRFLPHSLSRRIHPRIKR